MFSNFALLRAFRKWALIVLAIAFGAWYIAAYINRQDVIDFGIAKTREFLVWLGNAVELIPFVGSAFSEFILEQSSQLPAQINVNKLVVNIDDGALFQYWLAWAGVALLIWLLLGLVSFLALLLSPGDFVAGWRSVRPAASPAPAGGTAPTAAAAPVATAAAPVAPVVATATAPNEESRRIVRLKFVIGPIVLFILVVLSVLWLTPMAMNTFFGTEKDVLMSGVFGDIWDGANTALKLAIAFITSVIVAGMVAGLGYLAMEATNLTVRRGVPAGTPWRSIDTNHMAAYFATEITLLLVFLAAFFMVMM